jgi:hypothetical protein
LLTVCFKFDSSRRLGAPRADTVVERGFAAKRPSRSGYLAHRRIEPYELTMARDARSVRSQSHRAARGLHGSAFVQSQLDRYRERYVQTAIVVGMLIAVTLIDLACLTSPR